MGGRGCGRGGGFGAAAGDYAAVAPRLEDAADALAASLRRAVVELEGHAPFWGTDSMFGRSYLDAWGDAADLAVSCEQALRAMAAKLVSAARAYQATDTSVAAALDSAGRRGLDG